MFRLDRSVTCLSVTLAGILLVVTSEPSVFVGLQQAQRDHPGRLSVTEMHSLDKWNRFIHYTLGRSLPA